MVHNQQEEMSLNFANENNGAAWMQEMGFSSMEKTREDIKSYFNYTNSPLKLYEPLDLGEEDEEFADEFFEVAVDHRPPPGLTRQTNDWVLYYGDYSSLVVAKIITSRGLDALCEEDGGKGVFQLFEDDVSVGVEENGIVMRSRVCRHLDRLSEQLALLEQNGAIHCVRKMHEFKVTLVDTMEKICLSAYAVDDTGVFTVVVSELPIVSTETLPYSTQVIRFIACVQTVLECDEEHFVTFVTLYDPRLDWCVEPEPEDTEVNYTEVPEWEDEGEEWTHPFEVPEWVGAGKSWEIPDGEPETNPVYDSDLLQNMIFTPYAGNPSESVDDPMEESDSDLEEGEIREVGERDIEYDSDGFSPDMDDEPPFKRRRTV